MHDGEVISVSLARRLRDGGLRWEPAAGDRFVVADRNMDEDVFTLSDMTVEVHEFPTGRVIGFNGTVEWALDSVTGPETVWLPSESQLRERLGGTFRTLTRADDGWAVEVTVNGQPGRFEDRSAAEAYGRALLFLVTGDVTGGITDELGVIPRV